MVQHTAWPLTIYKDPSTIPCLPLSKLRHAGRARHHPSHCRGEVASLPTGSKVGRAKEALNPGFLALNVSLLLGGGGY